MDFDLQAERRQAVLLAEVRGLHILVNEKFADVQRQLDTVSVLPIAVEALKGQQAGLLRRVEELEDDVEARALFRNVNLPTLLLSFVGVLTGVVLMIHYLTT